MSENIAKERFEQICNALPEEISDAELLALFFAFCGIYQIRPDSRVQFGVEFIADGAIAKHNASTDH